MKIVFVNVSECNNTKESTTSKLFSLSIIADTIYFHLKDKKDSSNTTVYGVSCYRQIDAKVSVLPSYV